MDRFFSKSAVMLFLIKTVGQEEEILLQKRYNTGYADGMWECAVAGHVDANESMKMALVREAQEELGIKIEMEYVNFATITHKYTPETNDTYYNAFFVVKKYTGLPRIREPEKCSDLQWFNTKDLPDDLLPDRKQALYNYFLNISYDEIGWNALDT